MYYHRAVNNFLSLPDMMCDMCTVYVGHVICVVAALVNMQKPISKVFY